jgi:two-component system response regulator PilR (NtrC family)
LGEITQSVEKQQILQALSQNRWNQSATARTIGITLRQLRYKMEKLELNKP